MDKVDCSLTFELRQFGDGGLVTYKSTITVVVLMVG